MNGLRQIAVLVAALVGLAACGPTGGTYTNPLDGNEYRVLAEWPLLCHPDGSVALVQKANSTSGFTEATETPESCTPIADQNLAVDQGNVEVPEAEAAEAPEGFWGGGDGFFGAGGMFGP